MKMLLKWRKVKWLRATDRANLMAEIQFLSFETDLWRCYLYLILTSLAVWKSPFKSTLEWYTWAMTLCTTLISFFKRMGNMSGNYNDMKKNIRKSRRLFYVPGRSSRKLTLAGAIDYDPYYENSVRIWGLNNARMKKPLCTHPKF